MINEAQSILSRLGSQGEVVRVEQRETREQPPTLFNLIDLQKEANRKHSLTAQQTLDAAQGLYERHKLLTYPRTDSRHLTEAIARDTLAARLSALAGSEYSSLIPKSLPTLGKRYVDGSKVSDHHAIIPTAARPDISVLNANEKLVYDLAALAAAKGFDTALVNYNLICPELDYWFGIKQTSPGDLQADDMGVIPFPKDMQLASRISDETKEVIEMRAKLRSRAKSIALEFQGLTTIEADNLDDLDL